MTAFTTTEHIERVHRIEAAMAKAGFDALLAYSVGNQPGPVAYVGGYEPSFGMHDIALFLVVPGPSPVYALLGNAYWDHLETQTWTKNVFVTSDFVKKLKDLLPSSVKRLGIAGYNFLPAPLFAQLQAAYPQMQIENATELLMDVAQIKSPAEVEQVRRAAKISDQGARVFLSEARAGKNERALQWDINRAMVDAGADGLAFPTFILSGPKIATNIGFAENRALSAGEQINVLLGAQCAGYRVELGRVTAVGKPGNEQLRIMEATASMYEAMLSAVKPNVPVSAVAKAGIEVAEAKGYGDYLFRSINFKGTQGHGMGCWVGEPPMINAEGSALMRENMTLSVEARIGVPQVGGAILSEIVLVTPIGGERLSELEFRTWQA